MNTPCIQDIAPAVQAIAACCGTCRFHDRRYSQNRNGHCANPDSPRAYVVTGQQGHCAGHREGDHLQVLKQQLAEAALAAVGAEIQPPAPAAAEDF